MWQELCKTREEYLERAKLDTKGYSPRRSETLLYEIARLDGMDIKKQDFFNILNNIEISPKVTREDTHRIKDLSNAFLYLVKCAQQRKRFSLDFVREVSAKVMQHTGKEVYLSLIHISRLTVPHPRLAQRNFVLAPLNEIMPAFIHPVSHKTIATLLAECTAVSYTHLFVMCKNSLSILGQG